MKEKICSGSCHTCYDMKCENNYFYSLASSKTKQQLIDDLTSFEITLIELYDMNKYGLAFGVGIDYVIYLTFENELTIQLELHACSKSWVCIGHLRPLLKYDDYKGNNQKDYLKEINKKWQNSTNDMFRQYLERLNKFDLMQLYDKLY